MKSVITKKEVYKIKLQQYYKRYFENQNFFRKPKNWKCQKLATVSCKRDERLPGLADAIPAEGAK